MGQGTAKGQRTERLGCLQPREDVDELEEGRRGRRRERKTRKGGEFIKLSQDTLESRFSAPNYKSPTNLHKALLSMHIDTVKLCLVGQYIYLNKDVLKSDSVQYKLYTVRKTKSPKN